MSEPLSAEEEARIRRRVRDYREADWGDDPDREYHPDSVCQADEDASRLLATLDAARTGSSEGLDVERLADAFRLLPPIPDEFLNDKVWVTSDWLPNARDYASAVAREYAALASQSEEKERPEIVVLCGSTRFYDMFQAANYDLTMLGKIVLSVGFYPHSKAIHGHGEGIGHDSSEKVALDELHKRKIDLADRVYVLNVDGYIGDSTRTEIEYAEAHGKPIDYLEPATLASQSEEKETVRPGGAILDTEEKGRT